MRLALRLGLPALLAGLTFVACASTAGSGASPAPATSAGAGTKPAAVTIKGFAFSPTTLTVAKGTKVTFDNQDSTAHTITSGTNRTKDGKFDDQLSGGTQMQIAFDTTGTFAYFCLFHAGMAATIVVN